MLNGIFPDTDQVFVRNLENSALTHRSGRRALEADATLTLMRQTPNAITLQPSRFPQAAAEGKIAIEGNGVKLHELLLLLDSFNPIFEIVEPKQPRE